MGKRFKFSAKAQEKAAPETGASSKGNTDYLQPWKEVKPGSPLQFKLLPFDQATLERFSGVFYLDVQTTQVPHPSRKWKRKGVEVPAMITHTIASSFDPTADDSFLGWMNGQALDAQGMWGPKLDDEGELVLPDQKTELIRSWINSQWYNPVFLRWSTSKLDSYTEKFEKLPGITKKKAKEHAQNLRMVGQALKTKRHCLILPVENAEDGLSRPIGPPVLLSLEMKQGRALFGGKSRGEDKSLFARYNRPAEVLEAEQEKVVDFHDFAMLFEEGDLSYDLMMFAREVPKQDGSGTTIAYDFKIVGDKPTALTDYSVIAEENKPKFLESLEAGYRPQMCIAAMEVYLGEATVKDYTDRYGTNIPFVKPTVNRGGGASTPGTEAATSQTDEKAEKLSKELKKKKKAKKKKRKKKKQKDTEEALAEETYAI